MATSEKTFVNLSTFSEIAEAVKAYGVENPTVENTTRNLALATMLGKPTTVKVDIHVDIIPKKSFVVGKENCYLKMFMSIPAGTKIGPWVLEKEHFVEFRHWAQINDKGVYVKENYPEALKSKELNMTEIEKMKSVKTSAPTPTAIANGDREIAKRIMTKLGDNMPKFLELSKVAEMLGWDYVESHYGALVK